MIIEPEIVETVEKASDKLYQIIEDAFKKYQEFKENNQKGHGDETLL